MKKTPNNLPSTIGVYIFRATSGEILYIGKSVNIRARVKSHFENAKFDAKERAIVENSTKIETIPTESEFKALLLESQLIQKYLPKYNRVWMDDKSYLYVKITTGEEYPKISLVRKSDISPLSFQRRLESNIKIPDQQSQNKLVVRNDIKGKERNMFFGPFSSRRALEQLLHEIRRVIPFCTAKRTTKTPCFYSKIGLCNPCPNFISQLILTNTIKYYPILTNTNKNKNISVNPSDREQYIRQLKSTYKNNIKQIIKIFEGKTDIVLKNLRRELDELSKTGKYEEAIQVRDRILRFEKLISERGFSEVDLFSTNYELQTTNLLRFLHPFFPNITSLHRIECYDVSNLGGKQATAAMTVSIDGQIDKSQYRKFKIKNIYVETRYCASHDEKQKSVGIANNNSHTHSQGETHISASQQNNRYADWQMMLGVLKRRFKHTEWQFPDLIVVDGGKPQVRVAISAMQNLKLNIPVVGIAKNPDRLVIGVSNDNMPTKRPEINNPGFNLIRLLRDEAHRFGRKYHLFLRKRVILKI